MIFPDYPKRVFEPSELSDGTLRYLALAGALLGYRLPPFLALNEPRRAFTRTCSSPSHGSWYAPPSGRRSGWSLIPSDSPLPSPSTPGCCRTRW